MESLAWNFGQFTLLADRRLLMDGGVPVRLGGRALDILIALVEYAGQFVSRDELITRIWGERIVEEVNLRVQVAAVRRVLGDDGSGHPHFIVNIPTKGYCFVAPVTRGPVAPAISTGAFAPTRPAANRSMLVGRESAVEELGSRLRADRFVTIVGPGGVGKSAVAAEVAAAPEFCGSDGARRVDLRGITDARDAAIRIAQALEDPNTSDRAADSRQEQQFLLLLDGCEGVVDLVATQVEGLLVKAPGVRVLATSREPLRAPGEQVHRLGPLPLPTSSAASPHESPGSSVRLFSDRARAASANFDPSPDDARLIREICHRLDGIPLAIELAVHQVEHLGLAGILAELDEGFDVLVDERRVDDLHQQSLRASIDWSFANLTPDELRVLCRLSIFAGAFSLTNGATLASDHDADDTTRELIGQLATKSLVMVGAGPRGVQYRLLGATRAYSRQRLRQQGDLVFAARRHAALTIRLLEAADADQAELPPDAWLLRHAALLDDVRSSLDWLAADKDEDALRTKMLSASNQLWYQLSAVAEYGERASALLRTGPARRNDSDLVRIHFALGRSRLHVSGQDTHSRSTFEGALAASERLGSRSDQLTATWGLWLDDCLDGRYGEALTLAQTYEALADSKTTDGSVGVDRMLLVSLFNLGRLREARVRGERALASIRLMPVTGAGARPQSEQEAITRTNLARVLWIQGFPDSALVMAREAVAVARRSLHDLTACLCLHGLCVVAQWTGSRDEARIAANELSGLAQKHGLGMWAAWSRCHQDAIGFADGEPMRPDWREPMCGVVQLELLATFSADLLEPELIPRADDGLAPWCEPEVLRARGCHAAQLQTEHGRRQALALFDRALALARSQGALAWELRIATSIATLSNQPDEASMSIDLLTKTLAKFEEGFATRDLRHAEDLLTMRRST